MDRYRIFLRGRVWYLENDATGKQTSLHTRDKREAQRILNAQLEAHQNPTANLQIVRIYMHVADEKYAKRTWEDVLRYIIDGYEEGTESRRRWQIWGTTLRRSAVRMRSGPPWRFPVWRISRPRWQPKNKRQPEPIEDFNGIKII